MREDEIYILTKSFLMKSGWKIIGGQPPKGTDKYPVIEIKSAANSDKGSLGSFKPDLVATKDSWLLLCECKPGLDLNDVYKLREILLSPSRIAQLYAELKQRNLGVSGPELLAVVTFGGISRVSDALVGGLAFYENDVVFSPADSWSEKISALFVGGDT